MQIFFSVFWWIYFFIFFSGYPLLYGILYLTSKSKKIHYSVTENIFPLLPLTYAFVSTAFWILMLWTGKINFIAERIAAKASSDLIIVYSLCALLFWLPYFRKKTWVSFLHSLPLFLLPFFNMMVRTYRHKVIPHDYILNLLRIYAAGLAIYIIAVLVLRIANWLFSKILAAKQQVHKSM